MGKKKTDKNILKKLDNLSGEQLEMFIGFIGRGKGDSGEKMGVKNEN